jgi:acyl carrier protein
MSISDQVKAVLASVLYLGPRADRFDASTRLLGSLPELDSMAVVTVIAAIEERFGFTVHDDEISASTFESLGTLSTFVEQKMRS